MMLTLHEDLPKAKTPNETEALPGKGNQGSGSTQIAVGPVADDVDDADGADTLPGRSDYPQFGTDE